MSDMSNKLTSVIWFLSFWMFIATKVWGSVLAAWSWWWLLLPFVPWCGYAVQRLHL